MEDFIMSYFHHFIELHAHLDGSITLDIAKELMKAQNMPSSSDEELLSRLTLPSTCESLNDFLKCFEMPLELLQTKEALELATTLILENMKNQGVIYAELRFAPQLHTQKGLTQEEAILAVLEGTKKASIPCNLILCCMRGMNNEKENEETLLLAHQYLSPDHGVVALDLAGAEALYPTRKYKDLFQRAKEFNIPFTIHAGEADDESSVKDAFDFGAKRIGHGIRINPHSPLLEELKENHICLEMCPTSNRQTKAVSDMKKYPLLDYMRYGLSVTINTDDMAIEGTTLEQEFNYIENLYHITYEQEFQLIKNAISGAFCSDSTKEKLLHIIQSEICMISDNEHICYMQNGKIIAEIDFPSFGTDEITITHTFVDDCLRGQGYAKKLVEAVISYAKTHQKFIRATCSYAQHYFEKNPSTLYRD